MTFLALKQFCLITILKIYSFLFFSCFNDLCLKIKMHDINTDFVFMTYSGFFKTSACFP